MPFKALKNSLLHRLDSRLDRSAQLIRFRTPYCHPAVPFITLWSQKSGCTTVLKWHLFHAGLLEEATAFRTSATSLNIHRFHNQWIRAHRGHRRRTLSQMRRGLKPVINFMRNPWERAYSCYLHSYSPAMIRLQERGVENNSMRLRRRILLHLYGESEPLAREYSFLDYLKWLECQDLEELNPHHSPQYSQLYDLAPVRHFRLEDFPAASHLLEQEFDLADSSRSRQLFSSGHHKPKATMPADLALESLHRGLPLGRSPGYQLPRVTAALIDGTEIGALVERIFARDIAIYRNIKPLVSADGN